MEKQRKCSRPNYDSTKDFAINKCDDKEIRQTEDLLHLLGGYSWFQLFANLVIILPEVPAAMVAILPVFTGAAHYIPKECLRLNVTQNANGSWVFPKHIAFLEPWCFPVENEVVKSVVQEWRLIGNRAWITDIFTSVQMAGTMMGSLLASQAADKFGRKKIFYMVNFVMAVGGFASGLSKDIYSYAVGRFFAGAGVGGFYVIYTIYLMEFLTPAWRPICGSISLWFLGEMLLALSAYLVPDWRKLTFLTSLPALLIFVTFPFMPETPRFLLVQNQTSKAHGVFNQIARYNKKPSVELETVKKLQESLNHSRTHVIETQDGYPDHESLTSQVNDDTRLSHKFSRQLFLFAVGWFSIATVYYGISFNAKNLSGDPYWNIFFLGLVDLAAFPSGALFSNCLGRRKTYSIYLLVASAFLLALIGITASVGQDQLPTLITVLCFLGRFGVAGAWGVVTCFTAESFPTAIRSTCLGICCLSGDIGGIFSPQIAYLGSLWADVPYIIFCTLVVSTAVLSYFLTEMKGKPLQDTTATTTP